MRSPIRHGTVRGYNRGCRCTDCATVARKAKRVWCAANRDKERAWKRRARAPRRELAVRLKGTTCADCGGEFTSRRLVFHHVDPATRLFYLADAAHHPLGAIRAEAAKCVVVCRSCLTARRKTGFAA